MNLDLYHAQIGQGNLIALLRRAHGLDLIGEIQVAESGTTGTPVRIDELKDE
jgi:hydroxypyruvate isomerase